MFQKQAIHTDSDRAKLQPHTHRTSTLWRVQRLDSHDTRKPFTLAEPLLAEEPRDSGGCEEEARPEAGRSPARGRDGREAPDATPELIPTERPSKELPKSPLY